MRKSMKTKVFSVVASSAMVFSLCSLPVNVQAADTDNKPPVWNWNCPSLKYNLTVGVRNKLTPEQIFEKANLKDAISDENPDKIKFTVDGYYWSLVDFNKCASYYVPCYAEDETGARADGNIGIYINVQDNETPKAMFTQGSNLVDIKEDVVTNDNVSLKFYDNGSLDYYVLNDKKVELAKVQWQDGNYKNIKGMLKEGNGEIGKNVLKVFDTESHSTTYTFYIDQTIPEVKLETDEDVSSGYIKENITLKLYSNEQLDKGSLGGTWNEEKLDKDKYQYMYTKAYTVKDGDEKTYNITISAKDLAGNSAKEVSKNFTIDKKAPEFISPKNGHQYQGDIKVEVKDSNFEKVVVYNYKTSETKEYKTKEFTLTDDAKYSMVAYDKAGNVTEKLYASKDSQAPAIKVYGEGNGNYYREIKAIAVYDGKDANLKTLKINGETIDLNEKGYVYLIKDQLKGIVEGENKLVATDMAGNETVVTFIYDTKAPEIADVIVETQSGNAVKDGGLVNENVVLSVEAKDKNGIRRVLYLDKSTGKWTTFDTDSEGRAYTWLSKEGEYNLVIRVEDEAGNYTDVKRTLEIDKTAPEITDVIVETQSGNAVKDGGLVNENVVLSVEAKDKNGIRRVLYLDKSTGKWTAFDTDSEGRAYTWLSKEGEYNLVIRVEDEAGNYTDVKRTLEIDKTAPEITDVIVETQSGNAVKDGGLVNENVVLSVEAKDKNGIRRVLYLDKSTGKWTTFDTDSEGRAYTWLSKEGEYNLVIRVEDEAGNYTDVKRTLEIDKTAPEITDVIVETQSGNAVKDGGLVNENVVLSVEAKDKNGIRRVLYLDKSTGKWTAFDTDLEGRAYTWLSKEGEYNLVIRVEDEAGNYTDVKRTLEIDKTAPEITDVIVETQSGNAVKDGEFVNENVVLSVEAKDKNGIRRVLYLDKSTGKWTTFDTDSEGRAYTWLSKEGIYNLTLRVEDKVGNYVDTDVLFGIDKTAALASVEYSEVNPTQNDVTVTLTVNEGVVVKGKGWVLGESENVFTKVFTENASEKVVLVDRAGNETKLDVVVNNIDRVSPEAEITYSTTELTNKDVVATIKANEEVTLEGKDWVYNAETKCYEKVFTSNGDETVVLVDKAGNKTEVRVSVKNIDKEAPKAEVSYSTTEPTKEDVTATIKANEEVTLEGKGWVYNAETKCYEKVFTSNGDETVVLVDKAGNKTEVKVSVQNIKKDTAIITPDSEEKPNPDQPHKEEQKTDDKTDTGVQTDDENNAILFASLAGLALVGGAIVALNKKRENLMK